MSGAAGYRSILVHAGTDPEAAFRLQAALTFGSRFAAQVTGLGALAWEPYADPGVAALDGEVLEWLRRDVAEGLVAAETAFRAGVAHYPHPTRWRVQVADPAGAMARASCGADLVVASPGRGQRDGRWFPDVADLVMACGAPVLLVPRGAEQVQPRCVVIGWKNTRESRRAVSDALPLLRIAERVHLVSVWEREGAEPETEELEDVLRRLAAQGVKAEAETWPLICASVAEELLSWSRCHQADTLVVGAYGRSRRREWFLGGVTDDLLRQDRIRVLFGR
jgi:nucleotide-binding universal stress UspA family protein